MIGVGTHYVSKWLWGGGGEGPADFSIILPPQAKDKQKKWKKSAVLTLNQDRPNTYPEVFWPNTHQKKGDRALFMWRRFILLCDQKKKKTDGSTNRTMWQLHTVALNNFRDGIMLGSEALFFHRIYIYIYI